MEQLPPVRTFAFSLSSAAMWLQVLDAAVDALLEAAAKREQLIAVRDFLELGNAYLDVLLDGDIGESVRPNLVHEALTSDEVDQRDKDRRESITKALETPRWLVALLRLRAEPSGPVKSMYQSLDRCRRKSQRRLP